MDSVVKKRIIDAATALDLKFLVPPLSSKLPPFVIIKQLLEEYKKFLVIKVIAKDTQCSPSALIDQVWHEHILHTAKYRDACTAFGVFIYQSCGIIYICRYQSFVAFVFVLIILIIFLMNDRG